MERKATHGRLAMNPVLKSPLTTKWWGLRLCWENVSIFYSYYLLPRSSAG